MRAVALFLLLPLAAQQQHVEEASIDVVFENQSPELVELHFEQGAPGNSALTRVARLPPRTAQRMSSFAGHTMVWVKPPETILKRVSIFHSMDPVVWHGGGGDDGRAPPLATVDAASCADRHPEFCAKEAARGECHVNPGWMVTFCSSSCGWCHLRDAHVRCSASALNMTADEAAWGGAPPGALDAMFSSLRKRVATRYPDVKVTTVRAPARFRDREA